MIILVVVPKMILLQPKQYTAFHWEMMRRVMKHVVTNITEHQSGKDAWRETSEDQEENAVKEKSERNTDARRHHESSRVIRIIVMNTVNNVMQSLSDSRLRLVMKDVSMNEIFEQCPEQNA